MLSGTFSHFLAVATIAGLILTMPVIGSENPLPLKEVSLFRSGVGYFLRQGMVDGDAEIELSFRTSEINDVLKSMFVLDLDGGRVDSVRYAPQESLEHRLSGFKIDVLHNTSVGSLLMQLRGVPVKLNLIDRSIEGSVFSVENREIPAGEDGSISQLHITLVTAEGLQTVPISAVQNFIILDEGLAEELNKALAALAENRDPDKKQVTIKLSGSGERRIAAGYITEMPVWKMTYRLILDDDSKARLQGWSIVENTTDEDWENVSLSLVSGRPVSFVMNLYEPLFMSRPTLQPDVLALLGVPVYEAEMEDRDKFSPEMVRKEMRRGLRGGEVYSKAMSDEVDSVFSEQAAPAMHLGEMVGAMASGATGSDEGEQFFFHINNPVTLARRQSAMVPVFNEEIPLHKLSIYNPNQLADHPMRGVELQNSTGMVLLPGPVTVFDGNLYAGDARLPRVAEKGDQIISFAVDLDVDIKKEQENHRLISEVRIIKGVYTETVKLERTTEYIINNKSEDEREIIIEQGKVSGWDLAEPREPESSTINNYRFNVKVEGQDSTTFRVVEKRTSYERTRISDYSPYDLHQIIVNGEVSDKVKAALQQVAARKQSLEDTRRDLEAVRKEISEITDDQNRISTLMNRTDRSSDLYRRYMKKLGEHETRLDKLQETKKKLTETEKQKLRDLEDFLNNLTVTG